MKSPTRFPVAATILQFLSYGLAFLGGFIALKHIGLGLSFILLSLFLHLLSALWAQE